MEERHITLIVHKLTPKWPQFSVALVSATNECVSPWTSVASRDWAYVQVAGSKAGAEWGLLASEAAGQTQGICTTRLAVSPPMGARAPPPPPPCPGKQAAESFLARHLVRDRHQLRGKVDVPVGFGELGAVLVRVDSLPDKLFKDALYIEWAEVAGGGPDGATAVAQAHSFVFPQQRVRVFFAAQPCVPSQTPAPLARYRADELRVLQVLGQGGGGCMHVPACMSPSPEVSRPQRASNDVPPQQLGLLPPHKLPIPPAASRARASQLTTRPCHPRRRWSHGSASIRLLDMACPVDTTPLDQTTSKPLLCLPLQFATYNDLGPNRPILGGSAELPYPRRLFTGACCALRAGTPPGMRLCLLHASALFIQNPGAFPRMPSTRCSPHFVLLLSRPPPGGQRNRVQDPKGPSTFPAARRAGKQGRIQLRARGWGLVTPHWQTPLRALPTLPQTPKISNRPQFTKYRQAGFVVEKLSDMMSAQLDVMKSVKFNSECGRVGSGVGMRCSSCPRRPPTHVLPSSQQPLLPLAAPPRGPRL